MNHRLIFENALRLCNLGFSISPPLVKGASNKGCTVERWKPYQSERASLDQIVYWYQRYAGLNYAIITGKISGIIVVDADDEAAEQVVQKACPPTPLMQVSGSGHGTHYIYRHPMNRSIRNVQKIVKDGVKYNLDIRGDGGLFVGPGSIHETSKLPYQETQTWTLELLKKTPIFDPSWLLEKKLPKKKEDWKEIVCRNQWKCK
jgi:hypothetical protein